MRISLAEAEGKWAELVRQAEAGNEVVLMRDGKAAVRLVAVTENTDWRPPTTREQRRAVLLAAQAGAAKATPGPCAARSQDFLYDDDGLPG